MAERERERERERDPGREPGRERHLDWEGCYNARDLGGIRSRDGRAIRWGAIVRADALEDLTEDAWAAVEEHGIRTIIDLRNDDERKEDLFPRPKSINTLVMPIDNIEVDEFWKDFKTGWQFGTPIFYAPHVKRFPEATAGVIQAIANAPEGGVLYHCAGGRDRTGLITMLLLGLLNVDETTIAADYVLSKERLTRRFNKLGDPDAGILIDNFLAERGMTLSSSLLLAHRAVDHDAWRKAGNVTDDIVAKLESRIL
jgi:protein-tyrosine phosphatase